jgi:hypothetical protein
MRNGLEYAFAQVMRFVAVAQLDRFVLARGSARWNRRSPENASFEADIGLDSGIAARIKNLTPVNCLDFGGHFRSWEFVRQFTA